MLVSIAGNDETSFRLFTTLGCGKASCSGRSCLKCNSQGMLEAWPFVHSIHWCRSAIFLEWPWTLFLIWEWGKMPWCCLIPLATWPEMTTFKRIQINCRGQGGLVWNDRASFSSVLTHSRSNGVVLTITCRNSWFILYNFIAWCL